MSASVLDDRPWTSSDLRLYPDISPKICLWLSLLHSVCSRDDCPCSSHSCHLGRLVFFSSSRSIHPLPPFDFPMESEGSLLTSATFAGPLCSWSIMPSPYLLAALISARGRGNKDGHAFTAWWKEEQKILQSSVVLKQLQGNKNLVWDRGFEAGFGALHNLHPTVHRLNPCASWEGVLSIVTVRMDYILCILNCFMPHVIK